MIYDDSIFESETELDMGNDVDTVDGTTDDFEEITAEESAILAEDLADPNALFEAFLLDEISRMNDAEKEAFVNSEACELLISEGMLAKRNILKLTKTSDLDRRVKVAALQIAKQKGDKLYEKALKFRALSKQNVALIVKKYGSKATRAAKIAQKQYIRSNPITQRVVATPEKLNKADLFKDKDTSSSVNLDK